MNKTALITGSSRGIGKAIALRLASEGYNIILHGSKKSKELIATEKDVKKITSEVITSWFDISNPQQVTSACNDILKKTGVDVLINNAGIHKDEKFVEMSENTWDEVLKTNLYGTFYVTKQFLPMMQKHKYGRIINVSSIAARGAYGKTNYSAAKSGLIGLTKSLALEVGKYSVTVNAVCPGYIETSLSKAIPLKYREQFLSEIALGRIGTTEEVASLVSYLSSEESSYISGAVIDINGGWL